MTDRDEQIQLKLEGRCLNCKEELPNHLIDCPDHPRLDVLDKVKRVGDLMGTVLQQISDRMNDPIRREFIEKFLRDKNKDV